MTVYIWETSSGSYEDYRTQIQGVYFEESKAQEDVKRYEAFLKMYENTPEPNEDFLWNEWFDKKQEAEDYNSSLITKHKVK